jgi:hypothetical protein
MMPGPGRHLLLVLLEQLPGDGKLLLHSERMTQADSKTGVVRAFRSGKWSQVSVGPHPFSCGQYQVRRLQLL